MDEFKKWWQSPSGAYDRQHEFLAKAAWKAGREAGMREAAQLMMERHVMASEFYRDAILSAIGGAK